MKNPLSATALWLFCTVSGAMARQPVVTAIFPFGFDDTSLQGQISGYREDERQRLDALDIQLRDVLLTSGCCSSVDMATIMQQAGLLDIRNCNGCDVDLARKVDAVISITGWVQKVSNLILNINLIARNVSTGAMIAAGSVDIRGNTDESWSRGLSYLVRNRLHPSDWQ